MGIVDIAKGVLKKVKKSVGREDDDLDVEEDEDKEFGSESEESPESKEESLLEEHTTEEEAPSFGSEKGPSVQLEAVRNELQVIKSKLDLLEIHLQNLESKDAVHRGEADRYMEYLSYINEKLDHLEAEHSEIERIVQKRKD